jgi:uncharacterized protein
MMSNETARGAVDRLIVESAPGSELVVGFMGGEPLLNRELIQFTVAYAEGAAAATGHTVRFSITTNATLVTSEDARLFAEHPFQVAVSMDGPPPVHNRQRSLMGGRTSYERVRRGVETLILAGKPRHLSARATVTPRVPDLPGGLQHLLDLGFDSVGFAPVLISPDPRLAFTDADFGELLAQMIACAELTKRALLARRSHSFSNFETALAELERGSHRPYPCGAGAAYLSVNADGSLYACHRTVDDPRFEMGHIASGSDVERRRAHLESRHVDKQAPCKDCWARYLCGGGCYHEVENRGRVACDYIRGWLSYCIAAYAELRESCPDYFHSPERYFEREASPVRRESEGRGDGLSSATPGRPSLLTVLQR